MSDASIGRSDAQIAPAVPTDPITQVRCASGTVTVFGRTRLWGRVDAAVAEYLC